MGFFDRVKDSVSLAGAGASQKVSCTAETIKLNTSIRENEKKMESLTHQVGAKCVELHLMEEGSEYEELFSQIRRCREENEAYRAQIQKLSDDYEEQLHQRQQEIRARQEQREQERLQEELRRRQAEAEKQQDAQEKSDENVRTYGNCGQRSDLDAQKKSDENVRICGNCGQRNDSDARFCVNCGTPLPPETPTAVSQEEAAETNEEDV